MEPIQSFHNNHFCDDTPLIFSNGIFKRYYITDETSKALNNKLHPLAICPTQSHNLKVCPELYKTQFYDNFQKSYINDIQRRLRPYPAFDHHAHDAFGDMMNARLKKQRNEKKPVPEEKKDALYYEKRKRNNKAAKKSRDARKLREDQVIDKCFHVLVLHNINNFY
ncbi:uncharacterized protein LOC108743819 [Agrilus planipennis]|uniref:Uncharacterized protein LOC108743819 n=1 Tax=Agrilus planipennis TaxID=224129 RepID=A0A1W4XQ75_AGRPL|nr:uncharacterized protein LOC108743819 [Agrilus planipennis]